MDLLPYEDVLAEVGASDLESPMPSILLGNGFSIDYHPEFGYTSLHAVARDLGQIDERMHRVFEHLKTDSFEDVLKLFSDLETVSQLYGVDTGPVADVADQLRAAFVAAIVTTHPHSPVGNDDRAKECCLRFLAPYGRVFTLNYDLLLYWVLMHPTPPTCRDGFRRDNRNLLAFDAEAVPRMTVFYLHGALFLAADDETAVKLQKPPDRNLMDVIGEAVNRGQFPLIVAEGSPPEKLARIFSNEYLLSAWAEFMTTDQPIVVVGNSLSDPDGHIREAIAHNGNLERIYIGLRGDPYNLHNLAVCERCQRMAEEHGKHTQRELRVRFFVTDDIPIWR